MSTTPKPLLNAPATFDSTSDPSAKVGEPLGRVDLALAAILVLCSFAMFWKVIFTPSRLFFWDVYNYTYPSARFIQEMCRHGSLPYWVPYLNYGQPFLENPNHLFFYPFTLFIILLPFDLAYPLHYVLHFAVAGIGTYLLARRWNQTRVASFFSGFVFEFSGPLLSLGNLYNHAACAAWIPWALLATDRAVQSRTDPHHPLIPLSEEGIKGWRPGSPLDSFDTGFLIAVPCRRTFHSHRHVLAFASPMRCTFEERGALLSLHPICGS